MSVYDVFKILKKNGEILDPLVVEFLKIIETDGIGKAFDWAEAQVDALSEKERRIKLCYFFSGASSGIVIERSRFNRGKDS